MAEIIRAGLLSIEKGQFEAARSLGMSGSLAMRRIILPQALRVIVPPTGNEFISMLKTTSLLEIIAVPELFVVASQHFSYDLKAFEPLLTISVWYIGFTFIFTRDPVGHRAPAQCGLRGDRGGAAGADGDAADRRLRQPAPVTARPTRAADRPREEAG